MSAMESSTKNAKEMLDKLTLSYNRYIRDLLLANEWRSRRIRQEGRMFCRLVASRSVCFSSGLAKLPSLRSSLRLFLEQLPWRVEDSEYRTTIVFCLFAELVHGSAVQGEAFCVGGVAGQRGQQLNIMKMTLCSMLQTGSRNSSSFCNNPDQHDNSACKRYKLIGRTQG